MSLSFSRGINSRTLRIPPGLAAVGFLILSHSTIAQTTHWTGLSSAWSNSISWNNGIPTNTSGTIISVGSSGSLDPYVPAPTSSDTACTGDLTIQSGARLYFEDTPFGVLCVHGKVKLQQNAFVYLGKGEFILKDSTFLLNGGTFQADSGTITLEGSFWTLSHGASFNPGGSTAILQGTTDQNLIGDFTFNNLVINTPGTVNITGNVTVEGNLTVASGTTVVIASGDSLSVRGSIIGGGTILGTYSGGPLPVEMASFSAIETKTGVELRWSTATEVDNYRFEIQRSKVGENPGSRTWIELGFVQGAGTSNSLHVYTFSDPAPAPGSYEYRMKQLNNDGTFRFSQSIIMDVGSGPTVFTLEQNYPNPFNPSTEIKFSVDVTGYASVELYNALGQRILTLFAGFAQAGQPYLVRLNGIDLPSGLYVYRLQSGSRIATKKLMLLK